MIGSGHDIGRQKVTGVFYVQFCFIGGQRAVARMHSALVHRSTQVLAENRIRLEHAQAGRKVLIMLCVPATLGQLNSSSITVIK